MASGQWDGSGGTMSDISSTWNMSNLANGLPPSGADKQSRWGSFSADISNSVSSDVLSGGWGQSVAKDTNSLGWGQPDPDTGSDVGTKGWETSRSAASIGQNPWGLTDKPVSDWDPEGKQKNGMNREFAMQWGDRSKSWSDMAPEPPSSAAQNGATGATASTPVNAPVSTPQSAIGQPPSSSASASTPASETVDGSGDAKQSDSSAPQPLTREEIILRAINSNEPWGRTPIRQDTPWAIDEEPVREPLPPVPRPAPVVDPADAQYSRIGTAGWEQLRGGSSGPGWIGSGRNREDSGNWSISPADGIGLAASGAPGVPLPPGVTPAFRAPVERPASSTGGLLAQAAVPGWGIGPGNLDAGDSMWKDDDKKAALQSAIGPAGVVQQPPIRRNLSAGNWHGDESSWNAAAASGMLPDMDDVLAQGRGWRPGSRPGTAQPGQVGFRPKPDERGDNVFNVPPPALQPGFRPSSRAGSHEDIAAGGQWNSLSVKQQPQTRSRILQQLTDIGFRKEEAQSALINNNMDVRLALAELMSGHPNDPSRGARLLRCASEDMSHPQVGMPPGPPLDISSTSLFSPSVGPNVRFPQVPGGGLPSNRQQQVVVDQIQQQQQQQQRLLSTLLSSNMPPGAQTQVIQKLMQQQQQQQQVQEAQARAAISAESVQAALQQQQLQLLQSVQAAVQANLIPPHLIASVPSMSPTVANKLQRMMQLYDLFQKLNTQSQLPPGAGGGVVPEVATALANVKQQIIMMQQEVLAALASTATVPPPPLNQMPPPPLVGVTQNPSDLIRVAGGLPSAEDVTAAQASSKLSQWKQPTDPSKNLPPNGPGSSWPVSSSMGLPQGVGDKGMSDMNSGAAGTPASQLDIEEFVPGKPWQGPSVRSAEDDPFITPGSVTRSAISAVDDAHVMSVLGGNKMVVGSYGKQGQGAPGSKPLGVGGSAVWSSEGADGRGQPVSSHQQPAIGRSVSWAAGDRSGAPGLAPPAVGFPATSLRIRNLPPQADMTVMRRYCEHFGTLQLFVPVNGDQIILNYTRAEDAEQAQRTLSSGTPGVLPPLVIEFVSDAEVIRVIEQTRMPAAVGMKPPMVEAGWGAPAGIGSGVGGSMWGSGLGAEDNHGFLPSDLFGGQ